ncbi:MAG: ABC transporter ATP-binding protein [Chloroflexota bacterium]
MKSLLRLMVFARRYWRRLILAFTFLLLSTVFSLAVPQVLRQAIDAAVSHGTKRLITLVALAAVAASALRGLTAYGYSYLSEIVAQRTAYDIRNAVYDHLQRLSFAYYDRTETGQLMSRATADVEVIRMFVGRGLLRMGYTVLLVLGVTGILLAMDWRLALLSLSFIPPIGVRAVYAARRLRPLWLKIHELLGVLGTTLEENLSGVRVVKAFSRQKEESEKFFTQAKRLYDEEIEADRQMAFNIPLMSFLISLPTAVILWYGGRQVISGNLTIGGLTQFIFYLGMMALSIRRLGFVTNLTSRAASAGHRIMEVLDASSPVKEKPGATQLKDVKGEVAFNDVSFDYDSIAPVLKNISFKVQPGELVALVGASGSGKSTIVNLIPRFYDVSRGSITIDGKDIRDITLDSLHRSVGIVLQDTFLFSATIRDNIAYGATDASLDEIIAAAKASHLHDFIASLPRGYDTWVGERGITLSGGEKQRLAIARTLLVNPRILILDDSTSSVDAETEHSIRQALRRLVTGRTTFIITHRLTLIRSADLILVMDGGRIVEQGKHDALMAKNGLYREIYEKQLS